VASCAAMDTENAIRELYTGISLDR
jgi:hypothetical protein